MTIESNENGVNLNDNIANISTEFIGCDAKNIKINVFNYPVLVYTYKGRNATEKPECEIKF